MDTGDLTQTQQDTPQEEDPAEVADEEPLSLQTSLTRRVTPHMLLEYLGEDGTTKLERRSPRWYRAAQELFIDSMVNKIAQAPIYLLRETPSTARWTVIDGWERLRSIRMFMEERIALPEEFVQFPEGRRRGGGLRYNELLAQVPLLRARFDGCTLPLVITWSNRPDEAVRLLRERVNRERIPIL